MTTYSNTLSTYSYRQKYFKKTLQQLLRNNLVVEKIYDVDNSDAQLIKNPYGSQPTAVIGAITGTYVIDPYSITDDNLTVNLEVKAAVQIYGFEDILLNFDMYANRMNELMYSVAYQIDYFGLNYMTTTGTGAYTTPSGGFTTAANVNIIISNLISKVSGYSDMAKGMWLVVENTDVPGLVQASATNGFTFADAALNGNFEGQVMNYMGVNIYVVRSGTFATATIGGTAFTNSGHRVFGIKGCGTYAAPRGIQYNEKEVSGSTGKEVVVWALCGFKIWYSKLTQVVNITLTA
jgi:hypothetical protein